MSEKEGIAPDENGESEANGAERNEVERLSFLSFGSFSFFCVQKKENEQSG